MAENVLMVTTFTTKNNDLEKENSSKYLTEITEHNVARWSAGYLYICQDTVGYYTYKYTYLNLQ